MMKHVVIQKPKGISGLKLKNTTVPQPSESEVRIKILACGVTFVDLLNCSNEFPYHPPYPFAPGIDIVGTINAVGKQVTNFKIGQTVIGLIDYGGYAQYACTAANNVIAVDKDIDPIKMTPLPFNFLSAYQMLRRCANIKPGQKILVHCAGGGIGIALMQLAELYNLTVYATDTANKLRLLKSCHATPIDYRKQDFVKRLQELEPDGIDIVFDPVGEEHWQQSKTCLKPNGKIISYASSSSSILKSWFANLRNFAKTLKFDNDSIDSSQHGDVMFYNAHKYRRLQPEWYQEDLNTLLKLFKSTRIKPNIAHSLPLRAAAQALTMMAEDKLDGKAILLCQET